MQLSEKLSNLRKSQGLTKQQLADKINYSDRLISKWENGYSTPDISALMVLAKFYNISLDELMSDCETAQKPQEKLHTLPKLLFHIMLLFYPIIVATCLTAECANWSPGWDTILPLILVWILLAFAVVDLVLVYLKVSRLTSLIGIFTTISISVLICVITSFIYGGVTVWIKPILLYSLSIVLASVYGCWTNKKF